MPKKLFGNVWNPGCFNYDFLEELLHRLFCSFILKCKSLKTKIIFVTLLLFCQSVYFCISLHVEWCSLSLLLSACIHLFLIPPPTSVIFFFSLYPFLILCLTNKYSSCSCSHQHYSVLSLSLSPILLCSLCVFFLV